MSLLSIFSPMCHRLIRAYNHGQKLFAHENCQRFSLLQLFLSPFVKSRLRFPLFPINSPQSVLQHCLGGVEVTGLFIQIQNSIVSSKALVLVGCLNKFFRDFSAGGKKVSCDFSDTEI